MTILADDIGIKTADGFECLIPSGTILAGDLVCTQMFSTGEDNQNAVAVTILAANPSPDELPKSLGTIVLEGIERAPRGEPRIQLRITLTDTGQVYVLARNLGSGRSKQIACGPASVEDR
jgi:molecular chaperone DnaK